MLTQGGVVGAHFRTQCGDTSGSFLAGSWDLAGGSEWLCWVGEEALSAGPTSLGSLDLIKQEGLGARGD